MFRCDVNLFLKILKSMGSMIFLFCPLLEETVSQSPLLSFRPLLLSFRPSLLSFRPKGEISPPDDMNNLRFLTTFGMTVFYIATQSPGGSGRQSFSIKFLFSVFIDLIPQLNSCGPCSFCKIKPISRIYNSA